VLSRLIDLPRPRDLDICFDPRFTKIVHELRTKIAEVRRA
jgi:NitT/TauT family transport system ATP-binding protein